MRGQYHIWTADHKNTEWFQRLMSEPDLFAKVEAQGKFFSKICPITPMWRATKQLPRVEGDGARP